MIPSSCVKIIAPAYYAVKNTWFPAVVSLIALVVHVILAPIMMNQWGLRGLNLSSLISTSLNFVLLLGIFAMFISALPLRRIYVSIFKTLIICVVMAWVSQAYYIIKDFNLIVIEVVNSALALAVTIGLCGLVVVSLSHLFKMDEYESTIKKVLIKVKKKLLG